MGTFLNELIVCVLPDGIHDRVVEPLKWVSADGTRITVEAGFETDYASVPRIFWSILPPRGKYSKAAVLHDWLYVMKPFPRKDADGFLYQAMTDCEVPHWEQCVIFDQVRKWGWYAWGKDKVLFAKYMAEKTLKLPLEIQGPVIINPAYTTAVEKILPAV